MTALRKLASLSWRDRILLAEALTYVVSARMALWFVPATRLLRPPPLSTRRSLTPQRIAWAIHATARRIPLCTCLVRALAAERLMARYGHIAQLRVGVANVRGFQAHAWLECDNTVLLGATTDQFEPLPISRTAS